GERAGGDDGGRLSQGGRQAEGRGERGVQSAPAQRRPCDDHVPAGSCAGGYQTIRQALSSGMNKLVQSRRRLGIFVVPAAGGRAKGAQRGRGGGGRGGGTKGGGERAQQARRGRRRIRLPEKALRKQKRKKPRAVRATA